MRLVVQFQKLKMKWLKVARSKTKVVAGDLVLIVKFAVMKVIRNKFKFSAGHYDV